MKEYGLRNAERRREQQRVYYQQNKGKFKARSAAWRQNNPEKYREAQKRHTDRNREQAIERSRAWYQSNKERASETNRLGKLKRYGLTMEQFTEMLTAQGGMCAICESQLTMPTVDHCHSTGRVRGILCRMCNAALGGFRDSPEILARAIHYVTSSSSGAISTTNRPLSREASRS
jgi:hypothetical protein